ncbi:EthD family reductase [Pseudonocardia sp. ICBG162]|uniref:EthD family reductase n=1 Tax=Pseudonocardia sp. ICBG162 TaxID=2846761 RepID=UPI001CF6D6D9|nr:EthD family reductase [Pseudonocardia sp. ICBG162]
MHVLTVAYGHPSDPAAFDDHYAATHSPLARSVPGVREFTARHCASLDGTRPPYHLIAQLGFDSAADLQAGLASPEGRAAAADLESFADGGATLFVAHD